MSYDLLKTGNVVSFNTHSELLQTTFTGVRVLTGSCAAEIAAMQSDIEAKHLQVKPYIPGLPNTYMDYDYVIIEHENKERVVLGLPWIIESSITVSNKSSYQIIVAGVEPAHVEKIRQGLVNRGVEVLSFTKL